MTPNADSSAWIGWTAVAIGLIQLIGLLFLIVFFIIGEPFGTLNDACIGLVGILSAVLAWMLLAAQPAQPPMSGWLALAAAVAGALIVAAGSALVIFRVTGWVLAGFYTEFGNALVGLGLLAQGLTKAAIAERLSLSPKTVRNHVSNIFSKLQVADRAQAILPAREAGLGNGR